MPPAGVFSSLLKYPENSAGRMMTDRFVRVRPDATAAEALEHLRGLGRDVETFSDLYVVDGAGFLVGVASLRQVVVAAPGAQTVSTIIRGIALKEIRLRDTWRVIARELLSGLLLGSLLGLAGFARAELWGSGTELSMVVGLTVLAIVTWANTIGSLIPLLAQRFRVDPALVSAPLITTLVDASGLAIYLLIAKALLSALH